MWSLILDLVQVCVESIYQKISNFFFGEESVSVNTKGDNSSTNTNHNTSNNQEENSSSGVTNIDDTSNNQEEENSSSEVTSITNTGQDKIYLDQGQSMGVRVNERDSTGIGTESSSVVVEDNGVPVSGDQEPLINEPEDSKLIQRILLIDLGVEVEVQGRLEARLDVLQEAIKNIYKGTEHEDHPVIKSCLSLKINSLYTNEYPVRLKAMVFEPALRLHDDLRSYQYALLCAMNDSHNLLVKVEWSSLINDIVIRRVNRIFENNLAKAKLVSNFRCAIDKEISSSFKGLWEEQHKQFISELEGLNKSIIFYNQVATGILKGEIKTLEK